MISAELPFWAAWIWKSKKRMKSRKSFKLSEMTGNADFFQRQALHPSRWSGLPVFDIISRGQLLLGSYSGSIRGSRLHITFTQHRFQNWPVQVFLFSLEWICLLRRRPGMQHTLVESRKIHKRPVCEMPFLIMLCCFVLLCFLKVKFALWFSKMAIKTAKQLKQNFSWLIIRRSVLPAWSPVTAEVSASWAGNDSLCRAWRGDVWCCSDKMTSGKQLWRNTDFFPTFFPSPSLPTFYAPTIDGLLFQQSTKEPQRLWLLPSGGFILGWPIRGGGEHSPLLDVDGDKSSFIVLYCLYCIVCSVFSNLLTKRCDCSLSFDSRYLVPSKKVNRKKEREKFCLTPKKGNWYKRWPTWFFCEGKSKFYCSVNITKLLLIPTTSK